jgi:hypothetical protein
MKGKKTLISNMVQNVLVGTNHDIHFPYFQTEEEEKPQNIIPALINPHHMKLKWIMDSPGNHHPEPNLAHIALSHPKPRCNAWSISEQRQTKEVAVLLNPHIPFGTPFCYERKEQKLDIKQSAPPWHTLLL